MDNRDWSKIGLMDWILVRQLVDWGPQQPGMVKTKTISFSTRSWTGIIYLYYQRLQSRRQGWQADQESNPAHHRLAVVIAPNEVFHDLKTIYGIPAKLISDEKREVAVFPIHDEEISCKVKLICAKATPIQFKNHDVALSQKITPWRRIKLNVNRIERTRIPVFVASFTAATSLSYIGLKWTVNAQSTRLPKTKQ